MIINIPNKLFKVQINHPTSNKMISNKCFRLSNKETFKRIKIEGIKFKLSSYSKSLIHPVALSFLV